MADRTKTDEPKGLDNLFKSDPAPGTDTPPAVEPPVNETTDSADEVSAEEQGVEEKPKVRVKLNPEFQAEGEVTISVANHEDFTLTPEGSDVDFDYANLLLTSPAVVKGDE